MIERLEAKSIIKAASHMIVERSKWDNNYNLISRWFNPSSLDFNSPSDDSKEGSLNNYHIFNDTGRLQAEKLSRLLYSTVMPVHSQFFTLTPTAEDNNDNKALWQSATQKLSEKLAESNLSSIATETFRNLVYYGTPVVYSTFDKNKNKLLFELLNPETTYIDLDYDKELSKVLSIKKEKAESIIKKYGKRTSQKLREGFPNNANQKIEIYNFFSNDIDEDGNSQWGLYIVEKDNAHIIDYIPFNSQPVFTARSSPVTWEVYSRSFAMAAINSVITLNKVEKMALEQSEKHINPPIAVPYQAGMEFEPIIDTAAGGIVEIYSNGTGPVMQPTILSLGGDISVGQLQINNQSEAIKEVFLIDVLTAILNTSTNATATQIDGIASEKLDIVSPLITLLIDGFVKPIVTRSFQLLVDNGIIDMGDLQEEINFDIDVQSSLVMKLKSTKLNSTINAINTVSMLSQYDQSVLDTIDFTKVAEEIVLSSAMPSNSIRVGEELVKYKQAQAQAQQQAQAQAQQQEMLNNVSRNIDPNSNINPNSIIGELSGALR